MVLQFFGQGQTTLGQASDVAGKPEVGVVMAERGVHFGVVRVTGIFVFQAGGL
ncbi:MAG: hypothetical protein ACNA8K_01165 [Cyclonatronaceae bacterium]